MEHLLDRRAFTAGLLTAGPVGTLLRKRSTSSDSLTTAGRVAQVVSS